MNRLLMLMGICGIFMQHSIVAMQKEISATIAVNYKGKTYPISRKEALLSRTLQECLETWDFQEVQLPDGAVDIDLERAFLMMRLFVSHGDLTGKALLDAVEEGMAPTYLDSIKKSISGATQFLGNMLFYGAQSHGEEQTDGIVLDIKLLNTFDYLACDLGIALMSRALARKSSAELEQLKELLEPYVFTEIARYYFLHTGKDLPNIDAQNLKFSLREYQDYLPDSLELQFSSFGFYLDLREKRLGTINLDPDQLMLINIDPITKQLTDQTQMRILLLARNKLCRIEPNVFIKLIQLWDLDISGNNVRILKKGIFNGLNLLRCLNLTHNELLSIEPDVFLPLEKLAFLAIAGTKLKTFDRSMFHGLHNLHILILEKNMDLKEVDFDELVNLRYLLLQHNPNLFLNSTTFSCLTKLKRLRLEGCNLSELDSNLFVNLRELEKIGIAGNPLSDANIASLKQNLSPGIIDTINTIDSVDDKIRLRPRFYCVDVGIFQPGVGVFDG